MATSTSTRVIARSRRYLPLPCARAFSAVARVSTIAFCLAACAPPRGTIGAVLAQRNNGTLIVRQVPKGLAAERAGVQPGDEVLLIDGRDVRALSSDGVHRALSGEVGEPVKLTLVRDDRVVRVTLARSAAPARRRERPD